MNIGCQFTKKLQSNYEWMTLTSSIKQNNYSPNFSGSDSMNLSDINNASFSITSSQTSMPKNNNSEQDNNKMFLKEKPYFCVQNINTSNGYFQEKKVKYLSESYHFQARPKQQTLEIRVHQLQQIIKRHQEMLMKYTKQEKSNESLNILGDITNKQINSKIIAKEYQKIDEENDEFIKQVDKLKKHIKKMVQREQVQNEFKKLQSSIREIMSSFKKCFIDQIQSLNKKHEKLKKRISVQKTTNFPFQESLNNLKKQFSLELQSKISKLLCQKIVPSSQKFMGFSTLLKVKQQLFYAKKQITIKSQNQKINLLNNPSLQFEEVTYKSNVESIPSLNSTENVQNVKEVKNGTYQMTYYIDSEGYLLDSQNYYLLYEGQKIKLSEEQLKTLQFNEIVK